MVDTERHTGSTTRRSPDLCGSALTAFAILCLLGVAPVAAQQQPVDQGRALLTKNCSRCHGIAPDEKSRHLSAPPFSQIMKRYRAEMLTEALAEGLTTGHPDMPQFTFEPDEVAAIVRYLDTLSK